MKNLLRLALIFGLIAIFQQHVSAQKTLPLREKTSTSSIFIADGANAYVVFLTLQGHALKAGDQVDAVDQAGHRMSFKITKTTIDNGEVDALPTGEYGGLDLLLTSGNMRDFGGDFYLVDVGAPYPTAMASPADEPMAPYTITAQLGGQPWKAGLVSEGALFYPNGHKTIDPSGKPFLQLAFKSIKAPDDRQLTIQVRDFAAKVGTVDQDHCEVLLSGSIDGVAAHALLQGYSNKGAYKKYVFTLKITRWERVSSEKAILSATFSGKLKGSLDAPDIVVNNGAIDDLEVRVFGDK
jgi:hypothetical protein